MARQTDPERNPDDKDMARRSFIQLSAAFAAAGATGAMVSAPAQAQQSNPGESLLYKVIERGKLVCGTGSTNPPWHFEDDSGNLQGMDADMARIVAKALFADPEKVEFVRQGSDARIPNLLTNKVDVVFQFMTINGERAQQVAFTIPYYREGVGLLLPSDSKYNDFAALKGAGSAVKVSVLQNPYAEDMVHKALPEAAVMQFDSPATMIQAVVSGRADAGASDQSSVRWLMAQFPGKYKDSGFGWFPQSYGAAVRPGDQIWLNFVNTALHEAMTGVDFERYTASFKKWFGVEVPNPKLGFPIEYT